ncbi:MAG: ComEC/Rec2 family competence protein, partial [Bacteroidota bacterium]
THLVSQWIAQTYAEFNQLLLDITLWVIRVTGNVSFASVDTSRFAPVYAFPFYMALLLFFNLNAQHATRRLLIILLLSLNLAVVVPPPSAVATNVGTLRVTFLDVGQVVASVVELPDGRVLVIDAGPRADGYDAGERTVGSFLRRRGVSRIDVLVVSHPHDDHLGGVPYLLKHFDVGRVVESGQPINSLLFRAYSAELQEEQCGIDTARRGAIVDSFRDVRLYVIAPVVSFIDADTSHPHSNLNNTSVVLKMQYGGVSFLFSGDAEVDAEEEMVERYGAFLQSNVLKVGHHGSRTSSTQEFLDAVRPTCAVISVGRFNKFRHPSEEVLARLRMMQADVYRTDEDGAVIFESDGKTLSRIDW